MRKLILIVSLFMLSLIAIAHSVRRPDVQAALLRHTADTVRAPKIVPFQRPKIEKSLTAGNMLQREAQTIYAELYSLQSLDSRLLLDMNIDLREVDLLPDCTIFFEPWLIGATDSLALPPIIINGPQSDRMYLRRKALNAEETGEGAPYAILRQNNHRFPNMNYRIDNIPYETWMDSAHIRIKHRACDCDARLKPVEISYNIKATPFDVALRIDTFNIIVHDTTYASIHDTTYIPVHDTTYIDVHDTTYIPVHDTTYIDVHDTTYIPVHDTTYIDVHDTTYIPVHDTTYIPVHDTTYIPVHDTTYIPVHDTTVVTKYDTVTLHDTVRIEVPVYRQAPDTDESAIAPQQKTKRRKRLFGRTDNGNKDAVPESEITEKKARVTRKEKEP